MTASALSAAVLASVVAAARDQLRIDGLAEQTLLERLAQSAVALGEAFTGTLFVERACEDVLRVDGQWQKLQGLPVTAIDGMTGLPPAGAPFPLSPEAYGYDIDGDRQGWVRVLEAGAAVRVAVAYRAGLAATWDTVPAPIAQATAMLVAHLFEDRAGNGMPPAAVAALWRPWRRMALTAAAR